MTPEICRGLEEFSRVKGRNKIFVCSNLFVKYSFQCVNHFLHLTIGDVLKNEKIDEIVNKVRHWVRECRTAKGSALFSRKQEELGVKGKKLIMV